MHPIDIPLIAGVSFTVSLGLDLLTLYRMKQRLRGAEPEPLTLLDAPLPPALPAEQAPPVVDPVPALGERLAAVEAEQRWLKDIRYGEVTQGFAALQQRLGILEAAPTQSLNRSGQRPDPLLTERVAALEKELTFHITTKHAELDAGFRRLESGLESALPPAAASELETHS